ncbi:MAG: AAA family ATPase [Nocardioidaceae bacterium]
MRLHALTVTAFGPFAGTETVDFTELNEAGLFLLTGPTGAGKTSILDAVCFALFGSVPGVRGVKTLKSHHAGDDVAPEVVLDFTVQDRRFVVRRSPEWQRPKKRGTGLLTEKASATLLETTSGTEHFLSARAQEVGHLIGELVGMTASQFVQVAMLPQGGFAAFLRAGSDERHTVLQHLFRTDRFSRIEDWVNEHSRRLRAEAGDGQSAVQRILDTAADRAGVDLPDELSGDSLPQAASEGRALPWLASLLEEATAAATESRARRDRTAAAVVAAREAVEAGRRVVRAYQRALAATAELDRLERSATAEDDARGALDRHAAAAPCVPLLVLLDEAHGDRDQAVSRFGQLVGDPGSDSDGVPVDELRDRATRLEQLLPRERQQAEETGAQRRDSGALERLDAERQTLDERRVALPGELAAARAEGEQAAGVAGRHEAIELALANARSRRQAALAVPRTEALLAGLRDAERDARSRALDARELVQDLQDRRLAGIAAELAGRLEDGAPCQVCGATEHPAPARPGADAVTEAEQEQAGAAYDVRTEEFAAASRAVAEAERGLAVLVEGAGGLSPDAAGAEVASLEAALDASEAARVALRAAETRVTALETELHDLDTRAGELATRAASLRQACESRAQTLDRLADELAAATGDAPSVTAALTAVRERLDRALRVRDARTALETAEQRLAEVRTRAEAVAAEHGFADLDAVRAAALSETDRAGHERLVAERLAARTRAQAVLDDPEVRSLEDAAETPDVSALAAALAESEAEAALAAKTHHADEERATALAAHRVRLAEVLTVWAPVRDEFVRADAMSKLVRGMGGDNHLQMRLSAYVLATRLDQVVDAANERLGHMRDQRYLLQRTGKAARKGSQAGLGLEVVDQWTGDTRDPATLSGGETFVVSLSLALGLADVVTREAGGTEIETLFVDEGFGTLDPDTLDDVMDRLDGLRAGGRTVGVVSHVGELRNRIPTQVHVDKSRNGSRIAVRTLTA